MIKWEKIVKIEEISSSDKYVYDFSVKGLETFANADGIFVHNSVTADAQRWQNTQQKLMGLITETFRWKNFVTVFSLPSLNMLNSRIRQVLHAVIILRGQPGEEARVYRLAATHLGAQHLAGIGVIYDYPLPNVEQCKKTHCRKVKLGRLFKCPRFDNCELIRGQYERKKEEAFELLRLYAEQRLQEPGRLVSPYNPFGIDTSEIDEEIVSENNSTEPDNQHQQRPRFRHRYGSDVVS